MWNAETLLAAARADLAAAGADPAAVRAEDIAPAARPDVATDDLTAIEGIGPRIAELCRSRGYDTWARLGAADVDDLRRMLEAAGPRFRVHAPSHWAEQARLLAASDWEGFRRLIASLHAAPTAE